MAETISPPVVASEKSTTTTPVPSAWGQAVFDNAKYSTVTLSQTTTTFGRNKKCDVCLNHPVASGMHASLIREKDVVFLLDTSTNGTWINGKLVGKGKKVYISHGDTVHLVRRSRLDPEEISFNLYMLDPKLIGKTTEGVIGKYDIGKQLGTGSFAKVHLCMDTETGEKYAIKIIDKKRIMGSKSSKEKGFMEEVKILQSLNHPNIIKVYEALENDDFIYIVLQLVQGGDLLDKMIEMGEEFPEDRARTIFLQAYRAVAYLHSMGVVHRDLKPENILLTSKTEDKIKLTDFGLSRIVGEGSFMKTICGTPMYVAPEVISNMGQKQAKGYDKLVDVWSLGVILYMLLCGEPPFDQRKPTPILEQVTKGEYHMPEDLQQSLSLEAQDLVARMLCVDPKKRITIAEIEKHDWITGERKTKPSGSGTPRDLSSLASLSVSSPFEGKSSPAVTPEAAEETPAATKGEQTPKKTSPDRQFFSAAGAAPAPPTTPRSKK